MSTRADGDGPSRLITAPLRNAILKRPTLEGRDRQPLGKRVDRIRLGGGKTVSLLSVVKPNTVARSDTIGGELSHGLLHPVAEREMGRCACARA